MPFPSAIEGALVLWFARDAFSFYANRESLKTKLAAITKQKVSLVESSPRQHTVIR